MDVNMNNSTDVHIIMEPNAPEIEQIRPRFSTAETKPNAVIFIEEAPEEMTEATNYPIKGTHLGMYSKLSKAFVGFASRIYKDNFSGK